MSNPVTLATSIAAADADGIALSAVIAAGANAVLTGAALVTGGVAILTGTGVERPVIITSSGDDTDVTFQIVGTNGNGGAVQENLVGASGGVATSAKLYRTVTRVTNISAVDTDGAVTIGTNGVGYSRIVNIDTALNPVQTAIVAAVTGTVNYTLQLTTGDIQGLPTWANDANMASKTGAFSTNNLFPVTGYRVLINSGTGVVTTSFVQSGLGS